MRIAVLVLVRTIHPGSRRSNRAWRHFLSLSLALACLLFVVGLLLLWQLRPSSLAENATVTAACLPVVTETCCRNLNNTPPCPFYTIVLPSHLIH